MRISDGSSDVGSSDLPKESLRRARNWRKAHRETEYRPRGVIAIAAGAVLIGIVILVTGVSGLFGESAEENPKSAKARQEKVAASGSKGASQQAMSPTQQPGSPADRSEEHTSELQSLMRISYAVFCLKK